MKRLRISTNDFPENKRLSMWRDSTVALCFGRTIFTDAEPIGDAPFQADAVLTTLSDVSFSTGWRSPVRFNVTREHAATASKDAVFIVIFDRGNAEVTRLGTTQRFIPGSAVVMMPDHSWSGSLLSKIGFTTLALPRATMTALVPGVSSAAETMLLGATPALRLLRRYLDLAITDDASDCDAIARCVSTHILDLAALALGARGDAAEIARLRCAKAARLAAIKSDVVANLSRGDLSADMVATSHGISPRYVRRLFEEQGMSFSSFVLAERLAKARRMLADQRYRDLTIAQIAFEAGFGDISYFNRVFRRHFGATPSDFRAIRD